MAMENVDSITSTGVHTQAPKDPGHRAYTAAMATIKAAALKLPVVLPAPLVMGTGAEVPVDEELVLRVPEGADPPVPLAEGPLALMAVKAGAEQDVVGPEVRVTISSEAVVVGHVSQTTVVPVAATAAKQVCA